ncbi:MAG: twin-arginine translocase TatA/TatE family subunit [Acidobacteriaceae bacterium]|nr:twin-arginine translocase TatA/TatE family subunit [Acidobacteriaceae bacterium]
MGPLGVQEIIGIFLVALLLFGPKKLPELGRTLGKAISEFRRAKNELKSTLESHLHELERETRIEEPPTYSSSSDDYYSSNYSYPYEDNAPYEPPVASYVESSPATAAEFENADRSGNAEAGQVHAGENGHLSVSSSGVDGTVPRSHGVQPLATAPALAEEDRRD